ncbi:hypothetical protein Tco_0256004 [Tanacetum coccineum]
MSDSEDSTVTYTEVSRPFEDLSDIGSPRVDGPPMMPEDPYAYVVAAFQAPPSPNYVPEPENQSSPVYPLPAAVSPTADSPGYILESDPKDDHEEDTEKDYKEDLVDYPADRGDDDDDDDKDNDDNVEEDEDDEEEEEEEHPASADSVPPPVHHVTARISIQAQAPISLPLETEIPSLPLPVSPSLPISPPPLPASPTYLLGYRAVMIRLRAESPSTSHPLLLPSPIAPPSGTPPLLPIPLITPSPPLLLPSTICRAGVSQVTLLHQKRLCIALCLRYEVSKSLSAHTARPTRGFRADYGFVATLDDEIRRDPERYVGLSQRMKDFVMTVRQDTYEIYVRLDDAQDDKSLMSSRLNMLYRDRRAHARENTADYSARTVVRDRSFAGSRPHPIGIACGDTDTDEYTANTCNSTVEQAGTH